MFGAINSLFTGLALAGVTFTVYLQRNELELQRDQLQRSAKAHEKSEMALNDQAAALKEIVKLQALAALVNAYRGVLQERSAAAQVSEIQRKQLVCLDHLEQRVGAAGVTLLPLKVHAAT